MRAYVVSPRSNTGSRYEDTSAICSSRSASQTASIRSLRRHAAHLACPIRPQPTTCGATGSRETPRERATARAEQFVALDSYLPRRGHDRISGGDIPRRGVPFQGPIEGRFQRVPDQILLRRRTCPSLRARGACGGLDAAEHLISRTHASAAIA